jgi:hypothetical protein
MLDFEIKQRGSGAFGAAPPILFGCWRRSGFGEQQTKGQDQTEHEQAPAPAVAARQVCRHGFDSEGEQAAGSISWKFCPGKETSARDHQSEARQEETNPRPAGQLRKKREQLTEEKSN